jgi:hypothetical protein
MFNVKTVVNGFCSGCSIRTAVNDLQLFSTKSLLNFAALSIIDVCTTTANWGNNRGKISFVV